jgi:hypothetical protein
MSAYQRTMRQVINRQKQLWISAALVGMVFFIAEGFLGFRQPPWLLFVGIGFFMLAVVGINLLIRCPRCRGNLGPLAAATGNPFAMSPKVRYCPYCAAEFDASS